MKPTKPIHREDKGWGYEIWIHNSSDYCGKILVLEKGKRCSLHHHIQKKETFYIQSGKLLMKLVEESGKETEFEMEKGDVLEIQPGLKHQFIGIAAITEIMEFSTQHFETDSIRTLKGD